MRIVRIVRNVEFGRLFDSFFVSAVSTILLVRFYLKVTGYPQIGNSTIHFSHLLPGTLLLLAAILTLLAAVNRSVRYFSAVLAGIGFGLSWDELGKFITRNNNYFFKPTLGLIYLTFVLLYLLARYAAQKRLTEDDYLANVIDLLKEAAIKDLDPREYEYAKELMLHVSPSNPLYEPTLQMLKKAKPTGKAQNFLVGKIFDELIRPLRYLSVQSYFTKLVVTIAIVYGIVSILVGVFFFYGAVAAHINITFLQGDETDVVGALSSLITVVCVAAGAYFYLIGAHSRAFRLFEAGLLVEILVEEAVLFFKNAEIAVAGLFITLILLANVKLLRDEEKHKKIQNKTLSI